MSSILVADDELSIRRGMRDLLAGEGYAVRTARDGEDALAKFAEARPDLVLLDVMMPRLNGFAACERIRAADPLVPVIFLTAKDAEQDQVRGLGLGADDYVSKSAGPENLLARIRRALERTAAAASARTCDELALGRIRVNLRLLTVRDGERQTAALTRTEAELLRLLDARRGEYVSGGDIVAGLRGDGYACDEHMVHVHVYNLRRKLGPAAALIDNVRYAGYRLLR